MKYKFKIPIGDWSGDGHGKHEDYLVESSLPVEEVRELYFQACEKIGFSLDGSHKQTEFTPCAEYQESNFNEDTIQKLLEFGVEISDEDQDGWIEDYIETEQFCDLVLKFIKTQDKDLILERVPEEDFPMLQFYGFDKKQRHIGYFGYGIFYV